MSNTYCTSDNMDTVFGSNNIKSWSDPDSTGSEVTARVTSSIAAAGDEIDSWLRNSQYDIPLEDEDGDTPAIITTLAAQYAGVWLYVNHGAERGHQHTALSEQIQATLQQIRNGDRQIDAM